MHKTYQLLKKSIYKIFSTAFSIKILLEMKLIGKDKSKIIKRLEYPYCYYIYAGDSEGELDFIHYGYWPNKKISVKQAQENLNRLLLSLIPKKVLDILDVGCGLGTTVKRLNRKGYNVIGISPDKALIAYSRKRFPQLKKDLILSKFEDYKPNKKFDLLLFEETLQYIEFDSIFTQSSRLLGKNKYMLICDEFSDGLTKDSVKDIEDTIKSAKKNKFKLILRKDITNKVIYTRELFVKRLKSKREEIISSFWKIRPTVSTKLDRLISSWEKDTKSFLKKRRSYEILMFKKIR